MGGKQDVEDTPSVHKILKRSTTQQHKAGPPTHGGQQNRTTHAKSMVDQDNKQDDGTTLSSMSREATPLFSQKTCSTKTNTLQQGKSPWWRGYGKNSLHIAVHSVQYHVQHKKCIVYRNVCSVMCTCAASRHTCRAYLSINTHTNNPQCATLCHSLTHLWHTHSHNSLDFVSMGHGTCMGQDATSTWQHTRACTCPTSTHIAACTTRRKTTHVTTRRRPYCHLAYNHLCCLLLTLLLD